MTRKKNKTNPLLTAGQAPDLPKRSFLTYLWTCLGLVALAELVLLCLSFFRPSPQKNNDKESHDIIAAGSVDTFTPGSVTAFTRGFFYLSCLEDGGFMAFSSKCTHLGCTLPWDEKKNKFICPCHSSEFNIKGMVVSPPAPRPLDRYKITIENKMISVDTGQRIKRRGFDPRDVVYADQVKTGKQNL